MVIQVVDNSIRSLHAGEFGFPVANQRIKIENVQEKTDCIVGGQLEGTYHFSKLKSTQ